MASPRDKYDSRMSVASETNTLADSFYAESGTSAAQRKAAAKQQVWKIWFKLFLAVVFPLAAFITLTMLLVLPQSEEASVARKMNLNLQCIRLINTFTHSTQLERGVSASWVASQGANNNPPTKQRIGADAAAGNLTAFFKANLDKLDLHIVKRLSLVLNFIESRPVIREKVDLLPATPTETFAAYTEGIVLCHDTVVMLAEVASLKDVAFRTLAITDLLEMKEGLGKHRGGFSAKLSKGELTMRSVMELEAFIGVQERYAETVLNKLQAPTSDDVKRVLASNATQNALALSRSYIPLAGTNGTSERGLEYFAVQTQMVNALNGLLVQLMDSLSENATGTEIQVVFSWVLLSCCIVLAFCVAATMARAVAVPYTKLYHASERLTRESNEIAAHASASSKFVPYKTLELVGCYQVIDLKVGRLVLKRMIVMFGDIVSFTTLSSKMSSEEVFRYINAWLAIVLPHISENEGVVDKFLGDGFLGFFLSADQAVAAGNSIFAAAGPINRTLKVTGGQPLQFGIGCHSGEVCVGVIGNEDRMSTLALSQTVRTSNVVESKTRTLCANFLVTGAVYDQLKESSRNFRRADFLPDQLMASTNSFRRAPSQHFAGDSGMWLYESLSACWTAEEQESKSATRADYEAAVGLYADGKYEEAELGFKKVLSADPMDAGAKAFLQRVEDHQHSPAPPTTSNSTMTTPAESPLQPRKVVLFPENSTVFGADDEAREDSRQSSSTESGVSFRSRTASRNTMVKVFEEDTMLPPPPVPGSLRLNTLIPTPNLHAEYHVDLTSISLHQAPKMAQVKLVEVESVTSEDVVKPLVKFETSPGKASVSFKVANGDVDDDPAAEASGDDVEPPTPSGAPPKVQLPKPQSSTLHVKVKLWCMLVLMLAGPFVGLVVVSCLVLTRQSHALYDNKSAVVLSGLITKVKHFSRSVQAERAATVGYLMSGGVNSTGLQQTREAVNREFVAFEDYASQQVELPLPLVVRVAICQDIMTQREHLEDSVNDLKADPLKIDELYTTGIAKCYNLVLESFQYTGSVRSSIGVVTAALLLDTEELLEIATLRISHKLRTGVLDQPSLQLLIGTRERVRINLHRLSLQATEQTAAALSNPDLSRGREACELQLLDIWISNQVDPSMATKLVSEEHAYIEVFNDIFTKFLETEEELASTDYRALVFQNVLFISMSVGAILIGVGMGIYAASAVAVPFGQLSKTKKELVAERQRLGAQTRAVNCFVPYETLSLLGHANITTLEVGSNLLKRLTVLFVNVNNFDGLQEQLSLEETVVYLNTWLSVVVPAVKDHGGCIDKLMGDMVLMFFEKPKKAMTAAMAMFESMNRHNQVNMDTGAESLGLTIGMNTGEVCLGTIGTSTRMETTTIGDAVNVTSRVNSLAKMFHSYFLITHSTYMQVKKEGYQCRCLGLSSVKGRPNKVKVYEVLDVESPVQKVRRLGTAAKFQAAQEAFDNGDYQKARPLIIAVLQDNPQDGAAQYLLRWIEDGPVQFVK